MQQQKDDARDRRAHLKSTAKSEPSSLSRLAFLLNVLANADTTLGDAEIL